MTILREKPEILRIAAGEAALTAIGPAAPVMRLMLQKSNLGYSANLELQEQQPLPPLRL